MSLLQVKHLQKIYSTRFSSQKVEALKKVNILLLWVNLEVGKRHF